MGKLPNGELGKFCSSPVNKMQSFCLNMSASPFVFLRLKKGLRIYAMYPHTTSLYVATVVDNMTYCRGDDDIIVVEFDEDERGKCVGNKCALLPSIRNLM